MLDLLLDATLWFPASLLLAVAAAAVLARAEARRGAPARRAVTGALHLAHASVIGVMGLGHLVAVTIVAARGALQGSPWLLYAIGAALVAPAALIAATVPRLQRDERSARRRLAAADGFILLYLAALGPSAVLGIPAALNLLHLASARRGVQRTVLALSGLFYLATFAAALLLDGGDF